MKGISYLIIGLALVGLAVAGTLSQQGGIMTWNGQKVIVADADNNLNLQENTIENGSINLSNGNIYFQDVLENDNLPVICQNRPMFSNKTTTIYVNDSSSFQTALCSVPVYLNHRYTIRLYNGTYTEPAIVPTIITTFISSGEGQNIGLVITANENDNTTYSKTNMNVKVHSITVMPTIGMGAVHIYYLNFINVSSIYSDENVQLSFYGGSGSYHVSGNTFNGIKKNAILNYASGTVFAIRNYFNNSEYAFWSKREGVFSVGDNASDYSFYGNQGTVRVLYRGEGTFFSNENHNNITYQLIAECSDRGKQGTVLYNGQNICDLPNNVLKSRYASKNEYIKIFLNAEENSITNIFNAVNNEYIPTSNTGKQIQSSINGKSLYFTGSSGQKINLTSYLNELFLSDEDFTVGFWIKRNTTGTTLLDLRNGANRVFAIEFASTGAIRFYKNATFFTSTTITDIGEWNHHTIVYKKEGIYKKSAVYFYLNGQIVNEFDEWTNGWQIPTTLFLGSRYDNSANIRAGIDDFYIANRALNYNEINELMNNNRLSYITPAYTQNGGTLYSPDGTAWTCQVNNSGIFTCS